MGTGLRAAARFAVRIRDGRATHWGLAALIVLQGAWWTSIALPGYFRRDDFVYFDRAPDDFGGLWHWLGTIAWEHLAPGHRLVFYLLAEPSRRNWVILQLGLVMLLVAGLIAYRAALELLFGRSPWLFLPLAAAGLAYQLALPLAWPSSGLQAIPSFSFGAMTLWAFLRYRLGRSPRWAAVTVLAFTIGLCFYVRVLLVLPLLALVATLMLEPDLRSRSAARALWRDRWLWIALLVPVVVYVNFYFGHHGYDQKPPFSGDELGQFLWISWVRNVAPGFLGTYVGPGAPTGWESLAEIGAQALLAVAVVVSFVRKGPAALRAWALVVTVTAATFWLTITGKLAVGGETIGYDPRYVSDLPWQLAIGLCFALHPRRVLELGQPWPPAPPASRAIGRRMLHVTVALVGLLAVAASLSSARAQEEAWHHPTADDSGHPGVIALGSH